MNLSLRDHCETSVEAATLVAGWEK